MKALFIHQNFPGQFLYLARFLREQAGHEVYALGEGANIKKRGTLPGITTIGYPTPAGSGEHTHHYLKSTEAAVRRGQQVARTLFKLKRKGFVPDVISVHPGWGEGLFLRDVYPDTPIAMYCEFYYRAKEGDCTFDPEFPSAFDDFFAMRIRNSPQDISLLEADAFISPTVWQASRYPKLIRERITVLHDGVNIDFMTPDPADSLTLRSLPEVGESRVVVDEAGDRPEQDGGAPDPGAVVSLSREDKVISYVARNLEPHRGFHVFMRSLPEIQRLHPDVHVLIVGGDEVSYSQQLPYGESYKQKMTAELAGCLDFTRIHFLGRVSYKSLRTIFRITSAHIYLTYPFVLSWSVLEAMACEALVIGSATPPVQEVLTDGENGLLTDFFDTGKLARRVDAVLNNQKALTPLRQRARAFVEEHFPLRLCLRKQADALEALKAVFSNDRCKKLYTI